MRAKSTKKDTKVSRKELLKQYADSNEANKAKLELELENYKNLIEALIGGEGSAGGTGIASANVQQCFDACHNSRAKILWYLNIIDTNCRNCSALLEVRSLRKARRERISTGEYRADIMAELAKLEARERRAKERATLSGMTST